ncbi:putative metallophosphoesterase At3g03305 isoform X2 [Tripterygium wilfordii]|uniref:putative metallophosphoesterase At3g03305 isoform X2 n=1 Tax=Tripterygium wilfordii TaxID=458696 RepID=UPI0018F80605|nr:putative metallophosphoesterase At3g03305 isoform X2 [Tripterygium wilfordii]
MREIKDLVSFQSANRTKNPQRVLQEFPMRILSLVLLLCFTSHVTGAQQLSRGRLIDVKGGPESVVWAVQLSDLHFSVHHPDRALDFKILVGPALSMINPSLVLITGDLTDGKSKDLLTMKQNEDEWVEYQTVMENVARSSGLDKSIFYDLRGNHDNFGVPAVGDSFDFFLNYSINGQLGRRGKVNSVTLQTGERKHLFVGLDSTMSVGLRGPTNLFGHPTDQLLQELDLELSQWNSESSKQVTKISFGHFPLSFSAYSYSGRSLKDIFLQHSISAYLCGHLHTRFGKNLKRHHQPGHHSVSSREFFQLNMHQKPLENTRDCSFKASPVQEFWEWEMGDWRKSRAMRILAIDRGHVSYVDIDYKAGAKKTIILPTFPLDSRFMSTSSSRHMYDCQHMIPSSYETVRALVFSSSPIVSVVARVYDSRSGNLDGVLEASMRKHADNNSRGDLYTAPWNYRAFEDPSPDRYWLQIESTDIMGRLTLSEIRPFSLNGLSAKISWTWKEFFVMGCQWATLYYPILWSALSFILSILLVPKFFLVISRKQYTYKDFVAEKGVIKGIACVLQDLCRIPVFWFGILAYVFYLVLCPWFIGRVFTDGGNRGYMTYMGWVVKNFDYNENLDYIGSPDIMVVVLPHLFFVVLPTIFVTGALAAERGLYREHFLSLSGKKEDDYGSQSERSLFYDHRPGRRSKFHFVDRWIRKVLLLLCFAICWKHFQKPFIIIINKNYCQTKFSRQHEFLSNFVQSAIQILF